MVAIFCKTESSDEYLWLLDEYPTGRKVIKFIKEKMGEEFEYISHIRIKADYPLKLKFSNELLGDCLIKAKLAP